jgi:hypothetical protein
LGSFQNLSYVDRNIYFFRADVGSSGAGLPLVLSPIPLMERIGMLAFPDGRFLAMPGDKSSHLCCWPETGGGRYPAAVFATVRRNGLPEVSDELGQLTPLPISLESGLAEKVHVVFFPSNIVGIDFNVYGPRPHAIGHYLTTKGSDLLPNGLALWALLRADAAAKLNSFSELTFLSLRIKPSLVETIKKSNRSLGSAFEAIRAFSDSPDLELICRTDRRKKETLCKSLLNWTKKAVHNSEIMSEALSFDIAGISPTFPKADSLDLLSDKLVVRKAMMKHDPRSRSVDPISAFNAIEEAYVELKIEIEAATAVLEASRPVNYRNRDYGGGLEATSA